MGLQIIIWSDGKMYVSLYGKWFEAVGVFTTVDNANEFLSMHPECGVLAEEGIAIVVARNDDDGIKELPSVGYDVFGNPK